MITTADDITHHLREFRTNPVHATGLVGFLGFDSIAEPADEISSQAHSPLREFFCSRSDKYGVGELYRIGIRDAEPSSVGIWVGVLSDWGQSSSDRDRPRRQIAKALVEQVAEQHNLAILTPPAADPRTEAELIFPRATNPGSSANQTVASVRALVDLNNPTPSQVELLRDLQIPKQASLFDVSRRWQERFSVDRVATRFYRDYAEVRNRVADALKTCNMDHPVASTLLESEARAWATRQIGRVLFLWFLQAKGWLGEIGGQGSSNYLVDLWGKRFRTSGREYYRGILVPLFFNAMNGSSGSENSSLFGYIPYLNGGLFRRNALEDRIGEGGQVTLPDDLFDPRNDQSLLGLLSRYRFTTRESAPDDQSVDPDPELLGRVFENLYQGAERRDTGTYYTPREIVHFMCREVLDGYLQDKVRGVDKRTLDDLRSGVKEGQDYNKECEPLDDTLADALSEVLGATTVCDPAVGSGAFLLGIVQEMALLRRGLLLRRKHYVIEPEEVDAAISKWKRDFIVNNLHGVDVNPEAVEICQLRLWLSLVLDMPEPPGPSSNWFLPNLEFRIVAGDSLVDRIAGVEFKYSWPTPATLNFGAELAEDLQQLRKDIDRDKEDFENTHRDPQRLRDLRDSIGRGQAKMIRRQLEWELKEAEDVLKLRRRIKRGKNSEQLAQERVDQLSDMLSNFPGSDVGPIQKPFFWPLAFPKVLKEGDLDSGFDIVISNPPYVRQERLSTDDQRSYRDTFQELYRGTADVLIFFYARALQILKKGGWIAFITSNRFMRAGYGDGIRDWLVQQLSIKRVIDFGNLPVFKAHGKVVAAFPVILIGSRTTVQSNHQLAVTDFSHPVRAELVSNGLPVNPQNVRVVLQNMDGLLTRTDIQEFPQVLLKKEGWNLEAPMLGRFFHDLMDKGSPLGEFAKGRIYYGLKTGLNKAFLISREQRDALVHGHPSSDELIKPCSTGKGIKRWQVQGDDKFLIAIQNSGDEGINNSWNDASSENAARTIFSDAYPAIHEHLSSYEEGLRSRQDKGKFWWELRPCTYYKQLGLRKIVWGNLAEESNFAIDTSAAYISNPACFLAEPEPWLIAVMNSSLLNFIFPRLTIARKDSFQEFKIGHIQRVPIVVPDKEPEADLSALVEEIRYSVNLGQRVDDLEEEIDSIVFHVYGIPSSQRKLVFDWLFERREALGAKLPQGWRQVTAIRATAGAWRYDPDTESLLDDILASRMMDDRPAPEF